MASPKDRRRSSEAASGAANATSDGANWTTAAGLVAIFLASRLLAVAVAAVVERAYAMPAGAAASSAPILQSLTTSDATWFLAIARHGYHAEPLRAAYHDYVFFPLYPLLVGLLATLVHGDLALAGVAIANVSFAAALVAFERLSRPVLGAAGALWAAAFLSLAPGSVAFSMAYADSLFLLLAVGAMLAGRRGAYPLMAVLFGLATLTRLPGIVLIVPLAIAITEQVGWRRKRAWAWLASGPVALGGYLAYLWWLTGDPLAYIHAQAAWYAPTAGVGPAGLPAIPGAALVLGLVAVVAIYLFQFVYLRTNRIPRADAAYGVVAFAAVAVTARIVSAPRYIAVVWPTAWLFVSSRSIRFRTAALAVFMAGYVAFAWLNFTTILAPSRASERWAPERRSPGVAEGRRILGGVASNVFGLRLLAEPRFQRRALGLVLLIVLGFRAAQFVLFSTQIQWGYDFSAYWLAGRHLLEGSSIYSAAQVAGPYSPQQQYLYLYPPPLAAAVSPLSAVFASYRAANVVWAAIGALIVVGAVLPVVRAEGIAGGPWWFVGAAFAFPPVVGELVIGNVHLLLLGLLSLAWLGLRSGTSRGEAVAGLAVGIASIVKVFPALIVLWFLVTRRWAAAGWAIVGAAAAAVLTLPLTGVAPWLDYPRVLANLGPPTDTTDTLAPTVWLSSAIGFTAARLIVGAVAVAAVGWAARVRSMPVSFAVAVTASVLVAPALYHHYLAILLLPLLIAFRHADRLAWVAAAYLLMWGGMQEAFGSGAWLINRGMPAAGALLLFAGLLAWAGRSGDAGISGVGARGHVDSVPASL